jgi:hypothetical protein
MCMSMCHRHLSGMLSSGRRYVLLTILIDPVLCVVGFIENRTTLLYASLTNNSPPCPHRQLEWSGEERVGER